MVVLAQWSTASVLLYIAAFVLVAAIVSAVLIRRRRTAWQRFARKHGLHYQAGPNGLAVHGRIDNRLFRMGVIPESSDTGALGVEEIEMRLEVFGPLPEGLEVSEGGALLGEARKRLEDNVIETGDSRFDQAVVVHGRRPEEVRHYLTEPRREAVLQLSSVSQGLGGASFELADSHVSIRQRDRISRASELDRRLELLLDVARRLEGE